MSVSWERQSSCSDLAPPNAHCKSDALSSLSNDTRKGPPKRPQLLMTMPRRAAQAAKLAAAAMRADAHDAASNPASVTTNAGHSCSPRLPPAAKCAKRKLLRAVRSEGAQRRREWIAHQGRPSGRPSSYAALVTAGRYSYILTILSRHRPSAAFIVVERWLTARGGHRQWVLYGGVPYIGTQSP